MTDYPFKVAVRVSGRKPELFGFNTEKDAKDFISDCLNMGIRRDDIIATPPSLMDEKKPNAS